MYLQFNIVRSEGNVRNSGIQSPYVEKDASCIELLIDCVFCFNLLLDCSSKYLFDTISYVIKVSTLEQAIKAHRASIGRALHFLSPRT
jgi:hypothetical protein